MGAKNINVLPDQAETHRSIDDKYNFIYTYNRGARMKKKKNVMYRKSVSLLAAAAMTAVLMTGQVLSGPCRNWKY